MSEGGVLAPIARPIAEFIGALTGKSADEIEPAVEGFLWLIIIGIVLYLVLKYVVFRKKKE